MIVNKHIINAVVVITSIYREEMRIANDKALTEEQIQEILDGVREIINQAEGK